MGTQLPDILVNILSCNDRWARGRSIGGDCNRLYDQCGVFIPRRRELLNLCILDEPELKKFEEVLV